MSSGRDGRSAGRALVAAGGVGGEAAGRSGAGSSGRLRGEGSWVLREGRGPRPAALVGTPVGSWLEQDFTLLVEVLRSMKYEPLCYKRIIFYKSISSAMYK